MKILKGKIQELSNIFLSEIISYRRELHKYPELSMQEFKTSSFIKQKLRDFGISSLQDIATTGVIALVKGRNPDQKSIALRADMDALPIQENNDVEYKSQNHGVMHACGHDVHLASLLGTAKILFELRNDFDGTVKLFFQPSEEKYPGGAIMMIKEGAMKNPKPVHVFGQHVCPPILRLVKLVSGQENTWPPPMSCI